MSLPICELAPRHSRDTPAITRNVRAAVTRALRIVRRAIKEGYEVALTMAGALAILAAGLALDAWIWVPRSGQ
jgi:hypothetical protein